MSKGPEDMRENGMGNSFVTGFRNTCFFCVFSLNAYAHELYSLTAAAL